MKFKTLTCIHPHSSWYYRRILPGNRVHFRATFVFTLNLVKPVPVISSNGRGRLATN